MAGPIATVGMAMSSAGIPWSGISRVSTTAIFVATTSDHPIDISMRLTAPFRVATMHPHAGTGRDTPGKARAGITTVRVICSARPRIDTGTLTGTAVGVIEDGPRLPHTEAAAGSGFSYRDRQRCAAAPWPVRLAPVPPLTGRWQRRQKPRALRARCDPDRVAGSALPPPDRAVPSCLP